MIDYTTLVIYPTQIREFDYGELNAGKVHKRERIPLHPILVDIPDQVLFTATWRELAERIERETRKYLSERRSANARYQDGVHHLEVYVTPEHGDVQFDKHLCSITMYSTEGNFAVARHWHSPATLRHWLRYLRRQYDIYNRAAFSH